MDKRASFICYGLKMESLSPIDLKITEKLSLVTGNIAYKRNCFHQEERTAVHRGLATIDKKSD